MLLRASAARALHTPHINTHANVRGRQQHQQQQRNSGNLTLLYRTSCRSSTPAARNICCTSMGPVCIEGAFNIAVSSRQPYWEGMSSIDAPSLGCNSVHRRSFQQKPDLNAAARW
jgi:hypothetical protein